MPPRKGRKKRSIIASEKPSACAHTADCSKQKKMPPRMGGEAVDHFL